MYEKERKYILAIFCYMNNMAIYVITNTLVTGDKLYTYLTARMCDGVLLC